MEEMQDVATSLKNVALLRSRIAKDGYLLVRGLVKHEVATAIADKALSLLREGRYLVPSLGDDRAVRLPPERSTDGMFGTLHSIELFHALGWHPHIRQLAICLLGISAYAQPKKVLEALFPARLGGAPFHTHRDNLGGPWCRDMLTFRVALGETTEEMGGIAVLRGSQDYHHAPPKTESSLQHSSMAIPDDSSSDWVTAELSAGDVVLMHCYTIHKVLPNRSTRPQLTAEYRWQSDDYPLHLSGLLPYRYFTGYPNIPGWKDLTAGWKDRRWCTYPDSVKIIHSRWPEGSDGSVPPSRLVEISAHAREYWQLEIVNSDVYSTTPYTLPATYRFGQFPVPDLPLGNG